MAGISNIYSRRLVLPLVLCLLYHAAADNTTSPLASSSEDGWKHDWLYFEQVDIACNSNTLQGVAQSVHFWILPSGEIRRPSDNVKDKHVTLINYGFELSIDRLDDGDFGIYYCIVQTGRNMTEVVKRGVNVDGPFYGEELYDRYKRNAIIGGIAAGAMLIAIITIWLLCRNVKCSVKTDEEAASKGHRASNGPIIQETQTGVEHDKLDGWQSTTKIGESIYDSADALKGIGGVVDTLPTESAVSASNGIAPKGMDMHGLVPQMMGRHEDRLLSTLSTDSGHYQTIGSLERDQKLLSESGISDDVKILKTVIRRDWSDTGDPGAENWIVTAKDEKEPGLDASVEVDESSIDEFNDTIRSTSSVDDDIEYSVSSKWRRNEKEKETVVVIDGDVVIESNGTSVAVTTVTGQSGHTETLPKDNIVSSPDLSDYETVFDKKDETTRIPVIPSTSELNIKTKSGNEATTDVNCSNDAKVMTDEKNRVLHAALHVHTEIVDKLKLDVDKSKTETDEPTPDAADTRKISTASTPKSEAESSTAASVDGDTVNKYQSVLASLMSRHSRSGSSSGLVSDPGGSRSGSSGAVSERGINSRKSSADSTVFHDDVIINEGESRGVQDVRL